MQVNNLRFLFFLCLFFNFSINAYSLPFDSKSDAWLAGRIQGALDFNNYLESTDVDVEVVNGIIKLSGEVSTEFQKYFAEKLSQKISFNKQIESSIKVDEKLLTRSRTDLEQFVEDLALTAKIKSLQNSSKITHLEHIDTEVVKNVVYLKGAVTNEQVILQAEKQAYAIYGVKDVKNLLKLQSEIPKEEQKMKAVPVFTNQIYDSWVSAKVKFLLKYSADYSSCDVSVVTKGGNVELHGYVRSQGQKDKLTAQINDIRGVNQVISKLQIK